MKVSLGFPQKAIKAYRLSLRDPALQRTIELEKMLNP